MTDGQLRARNDRMLADCYPTFAARVRALIAAMGAAGYRCRIQEGFRSPAEQRRLRLEGKSKLHFGFHNITSADGRPESLAVDLLDDSRPLEPSMHYCVTLAIEARRVGCSTGLLWGLPPQIWTPLEEAIADGDVAKAATFTKRGWDPCHVEPRFMTPQGARDHGVRPGPWPRTDAA